METCADPSIENFGRKHYPFQPESVDEDIRVFEDKEGSLQLTKTPSSSSARSKHVDVRHHDLRELVKGQARAIRAIASKIQHADVLTKPFIC